MSIITEEMRVREKMCQFAQKYGVTRAARRYHANRQFVYRQLKKYDGSVQSLRLRSRRPHAHPKQHTEQEITTIKDVYRRFSRDGLAEVYAQLLRKGYTRCFSSMKKIISLHIKKRVKVKRIIRDRNKQKHSQVSSYKLISNMSQNNAYYGIQKA